ncbi:MAG: hypothetical protein Rhirs2KO_18990 [Rhizobiaceae bacterium]
MLRRFQLRLACVFWFSAQRSFVTRNPVRARVLFVVFMLLIPVWQTWFYVSRAALDTSYVNSVSAGVDWNGQFPFLYHFGVLPVRFLSPPPGSEQQLLTEERMGELLAVDPSNVTSVTNVEKLAAYLHYVGIWLGGDPGSPQFGPGNLVIFSLALMAIGAALWWAQLPLLALFTVVLAGSNPYQLVEAYVNNNAFSWPITGALFYAALCIPFVAAHKPPVWMLISCVLLIAAMASGMHFRSETVPGLMPALVAILIAPHMRFPFRIAMVAAAVAGFILVNIGWGAFFSAKHEQAMEFVAERGGQVVAEEVEATHPFWLPVWAGLGDFDEKYGFLWDDRVAHAYGMPIYAATGASLSEVLRNDVVDHIIADPVWYARILLNRAWRVLSDSTPPTIGVGPYQLEIGLPQVVLGPIVILVALLALGSLQRLPIIYLFSSTATAATPILITSDFGAAYYSIVHLFALALGICILVELIAALRGLGPEPAAPEGTRR